MNRSEKLASLPLDTLDLTELEELQLWVDGRITELQQQKREGVLAEIRRLVEESELDPSDVIAELKPAKRRGGARSQAGKKVPPKYRNPDNHDQTWAGRGKRPKWFEAAIEAGKTPDDLLIAS